MRTSLDPSRVALVLDTLAAANRRFTAAHPGEPAGRQPVHTVYGGAHLFQSTTAPRLGELALAHLRRYGGDPGTFAGALGLPEHVADVVHARTIGKLEREP